MAALATPAQLAAFLQQPLAADDASAILMLDIASGMVRDFMQLTLDPVINDVVLIDPLAGYVALLPETPVTSVSLLETFDGTVWTTVDPATYTVSKRLGMISANPNTGFHWPSAPESWRVTYSHGFAVMPMSIVGAVLGAAARAYSSPAGIDLERIGGYQVKYGMEADGFSSIERKGLARYMNPRIA
ncbi:MULTISPECIES: hypothetical protein [unclassified Cryobacterium]|uniref:hypothetical protein n=1 Tax=unclassified Cryobacterium TaxID=2649013 RepID=UPI00106C318E|nr:MULTISPECIES: hypothetical protein [unclassified Cryobacterium]TFB96529.1 hypothetical protein E3O39_10680 [Cryobacterium sp. MDB2-A-1]TFC12814.1 hypothetical protein E3O35_07845 [Cryobacterium sp. MDB2-A-2]